ncbi:MAG: hypothetical protein AAF125_17750 [Chloroflexota bacterium]
MPPTVRWYDDAKTITCIEFNGIFTVAEVFEAWQREFDLMRCVSYPIYSFNIFNTPQVVRKDISVSKLREYIVNNPMPHLQMTVQVAENSILRTFLKTLSRTMPHEVHVVSTVDEGLAIIENHRNRP